MAVFGAPVAHEDHARRACYAALQMLDDVAEYAAELRRGQGLNFSTRIGINSGEVVAGAIGAGGEGDYTAIGHTVGLAQRMEALAEPGKAYLTESTAELAARLPRPRRPRRVRDQGREPAGPGLRAGRGRRRRARGSTSPASAASPASSAATRRWRRCEEALERAEAGEGGVVGIVAEPGVGKSRLCHEFAERCRERRDRGLRGAGPGARQVDPVHAGAADAARLLRDRRRASPSGSRARRSPAGRCCSTPSFAEDLPLLFDFLGVPDPDRPVPQMSAEARQRALGGVVCRLVDAPEPAQARWSSWSRTCTGSTRAARRCWAS